MTRLQIVPFRHTSESCSYGFKHTTLYFTGLEKVCGSLVFKISISVNWTAIPASPLGIFRVLNMSPFRNCVWTSPSESMFWAVSRYFLWALEGSRYYIGGHCPPEPPLFLFVCVFRVSTWRNWASGPDVEVSYMADGRPRQPPALALRESGPPIMADGRPRQPPAIQQI